MDDLAKTLAARVDKDAKPSDRLTVAGPRGSRESLGLLEALQKRELDGLKPLVFAEAIARGGMGLIRRASQVSVGRDVAVKSVRPELASETASLELLREAWVTGALEHPNIVPVHDILLDDDEPLVVLKHIVGESWSTLISDSDAARARFGVTDLLSWNLEVLLAVTNAIRYAHSHEILHRDIKPDNVMIGDFGEVYVVDWGLAISLTSDRHGRFPVIDPDNPPIAGTPRYMAPEMLGGPGATLSPRTDIYLLGAALFEILAGEPPNQGKSMPEVFDAILNGEPAWPDGPPMLLEICKRALAKDPGDRFATVEEFRGALQTYEVHRASHRLADDAFVELESMRQAIAAENIADVDRHFSECRFGFEAALRSWPENPRARDGLEQAATIAVEHDLDRGAPEVAEARISGLSSPPAAMVERVGEAIAEKNERESRLADLERDLDRASGSATRRALLAGSAALMAASPMVHREVVLVHGVGVWSMWLSVGFAVGFFAIVLAIGVAFRAELSSSFYTRRLFLALALTPVVNAFTAVGGAFLGQSPIDIQVGFLQVWALVATSFCVFVDWRLLSVPIGYWLGYLVASQHPELRFFAMTAGHVITAVSAAVVWRGDASASGRAKSR